MSSTVTPDTQWARLREQISAFVCDSAENRLVHLDGTPIYEDPVLGVADGYDPLFAQYKTIIGSFHLTPREVLASAETTPPPIYSGMERLSVICWALPIARETRLSNRAMSDAASERWAHTRTYGEQFNDVLRRQVVAWVRDEGYLAVAPMLSPLFRSINEGVPRPPVSTWSERHALFAAGLGTFSLNDGFITAKGIAMRCGSVVTNMPLPATPRRCENHYANCLYLWEGTCGECIARCPAGALSKEGHDKKKCQAFTYGTMSPYKEIYKVAVIGCGLCQTGVPCEEGIPARRRG